MERSGSGPVNLDEWTVVQQTAIGRRATFPAERNAVIRASLIRDLLYGQTKLGALGSVDANLAGVQIQGATIDGSLDLSDSARPFAGLPALELIDCTFKETVNLHAARLARLALQGSRFGWLNMREAYIDGPLDISRVHGEGGQNCWIDGRGAIINGDVLGSGVKLRLCAKDPEIAKRTDHPVALWLAGTTIQGSVRLMDHFFALGGVSLDGAQVKGDVRIFDGTLTEGKSDAFNARGADIGGVLYLRRCCLIGSAWMLGVRTGGRFECSHTIIHGYIDRWDRPGIAEENRDKPDDYRKALILKDAKIGASVGLTPDFVAYGQVSFAAAKIGGDFDATGALLRNRTPEATARALDVTNMEIGANLLLDGLDAAGRLDLAGARIGGKMSFRAARGDNKNHARTGQALEAINVSVGGNADFGRLDDKLRGSFWSGAVNLTGSRIGGDLILSRALIQNGETVSADQNERDPIDKTKGIAIIGRRVHVQGSIQLDDYFRSYGAVLLSGATIGRSLRCERARLCNPGRSAIYAKDVEIGDDVILKRCTATGHFRFDRGRIEGSFVWERLTLGFAKKPSKTRGGRFDLMHARIGARLQCDPIRFTTRYRVDLTGARASTVELWPNRKELNISAQDDLGQPIQLDGFTYDRIELPECDPTQKIEHSIARTLRLASNVPCSLTRFAWLKSDTQQRVDRLVDMLLRYRQYDCIQFDTKIAKPPVNLFPPQPFRHMAKVLLVEGHAEDARWITIAEQWATPRSFVAEGLFWLYGTFFGFGLRPGLALLTLVIYLNLGTWATWYALHHDWMVETPLIAASSFSDENDDGKNHRIRAFTRIPSSPDQKQLIADDLSCHDLTHPWDAAVYAVDTVLPFIRLNQESKCEVRPEPEYYAARLARAVYAIVGWVVTSLTLLTWSGILRRFESEGE